MTDKMFSLYTDAEIADALVLPQKLTKKQQTEAGLKLAKARQNSLEAMSEADILKARLLQLKFQLEDYLKASNYDREKNFGFFLKKYLAITNKKRNEFAAEINIHETLLSQLVNNHREPGENIFIRLELHSNNTIPAPYWYKLVEKEKEHYIKTNSSLRKREKKFVKNRLRVSF